MPVVKQILFKPKGVLLDMTSSFKRKSVRAESIFVEREHGG